MASVPCPPYIFFFNVPAPPEIYTLSLHDALPISRLVVLWIPRSRAGWPSGLRPETRSADRKSTRLNSSHVEISYAVLCLKKKKREVREALGVNNRCESLDRADADASGILLLVCELWCVVRPGPAVPAYLAVFFFSDTATTVIYTLSLHDALPI